ncbi:hypothetical protein J2T56_000296 [Natronobacillus azotifigens]
MYKFKMKKLFVSFTLIFFIMNIITISGVEAGIAKPSINRDLSKNDQYNFSDKAR